MNEILRAKGNRKYNGYNTMKRQWASTIETLLNFQEFDPITKPGHFTFVHFEPSRRRDPDNFAFGCQKISLDALQIAVTSDGSTKLLEGDGWTHVLGFRHYWRLSAPKPGVALFVTQDAVDETEAVECASWLQMGMNMPGNSAVVQETCQAIVQSAHGCPPGEGMSNGLTAQIGSHEK